MNKKMEDEMMDLLRKCSKSFEEKDNILNELREKIEEMKQYGQTPQIEQPTFSVGMRVESKRDYLMGMTGEQLFTAKMVYRINREAKNKFYLITDNGEEISFTKDKMSTYFTPYEKPEVGDEYWFISTLRNFNEYWIDSENNNQLWNLGLAFKTKEQAEFARERLSKLF